MGDIAELLTWLHLIYEIPYGSAVVWIPLMSLIIFAIERIVVVKDRLTVGIRLIDASLIWISTVFFFVFTQGWHPKSSSLSHWWRWGRRGFSPGFELQGLTSGLWCQFCNKKIRKWVKRKKKGKKNKNCG
jgi:hypothetical protein